MCSALFFFYSKNKGVLCEILFQIMGNEIFFQLYAMSRVGPAFQIRKNIDEK